MEDGGYLYDITTVITSVIMVYYYTCLASTNVSYFYQYHHWHQILTGSASFDREKVPKFDIFPRGDLYLTSVWPTFIGDTFLITETIQPYA